jgi:hypothetical protein
VSAAEAFAKFVSFAAENPGTAITGAIVASIGKASIGAGVSGAVSKLIEGAGAKMTGGMSLALGSAMIAITTATLVAQALNEEKAKGAEGVKNNIAEANKIVTAAEEEFKNTKTLSTDTQRKLDNARATIVESEDMARQYRGAGGDERYKGDESLLSMRTIGAGARQAWDVATTDMTMGSLGAGRQASDQSREISMMRLSIDGMRAEIAKNAGKTQKVEVTNMPGAPGPVANTANTTK